MNNSILNSISNKSNIIIQNMNNNYYNSIKYKFGFNIYNSYLYLLLSISFDYLFVNL